MTEYYRYALRNIHASIYYGVDAAFTSIPSCHYPTPHAKQSFYQTGTRLEE